MNTELERWAERDQAKAEIERLRTSERTYCEAFAMACRDLDAQQAEVTRLRDALFLFAGQHRCGCGHPACTRCADDRIAEAALGVSPTNHSGPAR